MLCACEICVCEMCEGSRNVGKQQYVQRPMPHACCMGRIRICLSVSVA
jgi:hypothetical protein